MAGIYHAYTPATQSNIVMTRYLVWLQLYVVFINLSINNNKSRFLTYDNLLNLSIISKRLPQWYTTSPATAFVYCVYMSIYVNDPVVIKADLSILIKNRFLFMMIACALRARQIYLIVRDNYIILYFICCYWYTLFSIFNRTAIFAILTLLQLLPSKDNW